MLPAQVREPLAEHPSRRCAIREMHEARSSVNGADVGRAAAVA
jgi:hypothetical protein